MTPQDTHHDSLSIYYDFLEESGNNTSELRENLISPNSFHWYCVYRYYSVGSADFSYSVGSSVGGVGYVGGDIVGSIGINVGIPGDVGD